MDDINIEHIGLGKYRITPNINTPNGLRGNIHFGEEGGSYIPQGNGLMDQITPVDNWGGSFTENHLTKIFREESERKYRSDVEIADTQLNRYLGDLQIIEQFKQMWKDQIMYGTSTFSIIYPSKKERINKIKKISL